MLFLNAFINSTVFLFLIIIVAPTRPASTIPTTKAFFLNWFIDEFIIELKEALAPDADLLFGDVPFTGINMPLLEFDTTATERDTGFKASISFGEGVKRTIDWILSVENK